MSKLQEIIEVMAEEYRFEISVDNYKKAEVIKEALIFLKTLEPEAAKELE